MYRAILPTHTGAYTEGRQMSSNKARRILESRLADKWGNTTPIYWDDINDKPVPGQAFIRCTLDAVDSETISIKCQRNYDTFSIQVFTPKGSGSEDNFALCDSLVQIFRGYTEENLICTRTLNERVGKENEWYQRNVTVDTQYDDYVDPLP